MALKENDPRLQQLRAASAAYRENAEKMLSDIESSMSDADIVMLDEIMSAQENEANGMVAVTSNSAGAVLASNPNPNMSVCNVMTMNPGMIIPVDPVNYNNESEEEPWEGLLCLSEEDNKKFIAAQTAARNRMNAEYAAAQQAKLAQESTTNNVSINNANPDIVRVRSDRGYFSVPNPDTLKGKEVSDEFFEHTLDVIDRAKPDQAKMMMDAWYNQNKKLHARILMARPDLYYICGYSRDQEDIMRQRQSEMYGAYYDNVQDQYTSDDPYFNWYVLHAQGKRYQYPAQKAFKEWMHWMYGINPFDFQTAKQLTDTVNQLEKQRELYCHIHMVYQRNNGNKDWESFKFVPGEELYNRYLESKKLKEEEEENKKKSYIEECIEKDGVVFDIPDDNGYVIRRDVSVKIYDPETDTIVCEHKAQHRCKSGKGYYVSTVYDEQRKAAEQAAIAETERFDRIRRYQEAMEYQQLQNKKNAMYQEYKRRGLSDEQFFVDWDYYSHMEAFKEGNVFVNNFMRTKAMEEYFRRMGMNNPYDGVHKHDYDAIGMGRGSICYNKAGGPLKGFFTSYGAKRDYKYAQLVAERDGIDLNDDEFMARKLQEEYDIKQRDWDNLTKEKMLDTHWGMPPRPETIAKAMGKPNIDDITTLEDFDRPQHQYDYDFNHPDHKTKNYFQPNPDGSDSPYTARKRVRDLESNLPKLISKTGEELPEEKVITNVIFGDNNEEIGEEQVTMDRKQCIEFYKQNNILSPECIQSLEQYENDLVVARQHLHECMWWEENNHTVAEPCSSNYQNNQDPELVLTHTPVSAPSPNTGYNPNKGDVTGLSPEQIASIPINNRNEDVVNLMRSFNTMRNSILYDKAEEMLSNRHSRSRSPEEIADAKSKLENRMRGNRASRRCAKKKKVNNDETYQ